MPKRRYERREPTHDWQEIRPLLKDSAQITYEILRPVLLWGQTPKERGVETGMSPRTIYYRANLFDQDRKSKRLNSSTSQNSYAVFCLKKKNSPPPHLQRPPPASFPSPLRCTPAPASPRGSRHCLRPEQQKCQSRRASTRSPDSDRAPA